VAGGGLGVGGWGLGVGGWGLGVFGGLVFSVFARVGAGGGGGGQPGGKHARSHTQREWHIDECTRVMLLRLDTSNTTTDLSAYKQPTLLPSTDIVTLLTSGCLLFIASMYAASSAKGRGSVALYNRESVSKSRTIPSLHPQATMSRLHDMEDAPDTCHMSRSSPTIGQSHTLTSTHLVRALCESNMQRKPSCDNA